MGTKQRIAAAGLLLAMSVPGWGGPAHATEEETAPPRLVGANAGAEIMAFFAYITQPFRIGDGDDPAIMGGTTRHDPWKQTFNGRVDFIPETRTSFVTGMIWGGYEVTDHLGLGPNQRLVVGGFYQHNRAWTTFGGTGEQSLSINTFGPIVAYLYDSWHVSAAAGFSWGHGKHTSFPSGNSGSFDADAQGFGIQVGRVITLWGDGYATTRPGRPETWPFGVRQASVYLDPAFRFGYLRNQADAFTNAGGTEFGKEVERTWTVGGSVTLSAVIPQNGMLWRPYLQFSLDRQVGYDHTIDIPGTVSTLDHDKTYWGVSGGVGVWLNRNVSLGLSGFYRGSGSQEAGGALFWLRVNLFGPGGYLRGGRL